MRKVLVLGAGGMAGHVVALHLRELGYVVETLSATHALDKNTHPVDLMKIGQLEALLSATEYDVIVNCVGILVKQSNEHKDLASYLNSYLPHFLESRFMSSNTKIIHLSTDCVFSGKKPPYLEKSSYDGELFYDRSKALGEIINDKDLTFRMSIIGPDMQEDGTGLFNWFYGQTGEISGYTTAIWSGVTTIELAKGVHAAMEQNLTGLYHLVPKTSISKLELLKLFKKTFEREDIQIKPTESATIDKTLLNTRIDFDFQAGSYEVMLEEMRTWISNHKQIYPHYVTAYEEIS